MHIGLESLCVTDILGFFDDDNLSLGHHGVAFGSIDNLGSRNVRAEQDCLVEITFLWLQGIFGYPVANLVDIIALLAHQVIHWGELTLFQVAHDCFKSHCCHAAKLQRF